MQNVGSQIIVADLIIGLYHRKDHWSANNPGNLLSLFSHRSRDYWLGYRRSWFEEKRLRRGNHRWNRFGIGIASDCVD